MSLEQTTNAQEVVEPYQYQIEVQQGLPPTGGTYVLLPPVESLGIKTEGGIVDVSQIGPEDLLSLIDDLETFETIWKFKVTDATYAMIKRAINAANAVTPTGTVSESMTILFAFLLNSAKKYVVFKGSRIKDISGAIALGKEHIFTVTMIHTDITIPATGHGLGGTPTILTAFPTGEVWSWDKVVTPVSWGGVAQNCTEFNFTVNRNAKANHIIGQTKPYNAKTHGRRIGGDFSTLYTNVSLETDSRAPKTARTLIVVLKTSFSLTFLSTKISYSKEDLASEGDADAIEKCTFKSISANLP